MCRCVLCGKLLSSHIQSSVREDGCMWCYPDYDGGVKGSSLDESSLSPEDELKPLVEPLTSIHRAKKNVGVFSLENVDKDLFIHNRLRDFHLNNKDVEINKSKTKGVRYY